MDQLTDQTWTDIATHLDQGDLHSFTLGSKRFAQLGNNLLCECPIVPPPTKTRRTNQLGSFLTTVLASLSLASRIRCLQLYPRLQRGDSSAVRRSPVEARVLKPSAPYHFSSVLQKASVRVSEYALVGVILRYVPNLEDLRIEMFSPQRGLKPTIQKFFWQGGDQTAPMNAMFGADTDLLRIQGLKKLKRLRYTAPHIDRQWCELPSLEYLYVGYDCAMSACSPARSSTIHTMEVEIHTWLFEESDAYTDVPSFFQRFNVLTHLTFHIFDYTHTSQDEFERLSEWDQDEEEPDYKAASWHTLINYISGVASTLEELRIIPRTDPGADQPESISFVNQLLPVKTWISLIALRCLDVPFYAIQTDTDEEPDRGSTLIISDYSPSTLEVLDMTCAPLESSFKNFLGAIHDNITHLPSSRTVRLNTENALWVWRPVESHDVDDALSIWGYALEKLEEVGVTFVIFGNGY